MKDLSKDKLINILESSLIPSLNSIELGKNVINDFLYRNISKYSNIAELYQENSKWNEYIIECFITENEIVKEVKRWYLTTTCKLKEEDIDYKEAKEIFKDINSFPKELKNLFENLLKESEEMELLYDVDILLLYKNNLYRCIPLSKYFILEKKMDERAISLLKNSIVDEATKYLDKSLGIFFIVGVPWRNMIFYGQRGYKNMFLQAGKLVYYISVTGSNNGLKILNFPNFYDNQVNRVLNLDGVENFVLTILPIFERDNE